MEEKLVLLCTKVNRSERNVGKDIKMSVPKPVHRSHSTIQSSAQRSQNPRNFEKLYYFIFKVLDLQQYSYITNINN